MKHGLRLPQHIGNLPIDVFSHPSGMTLLLSQHPWVLNNHSKLFIAQQNYGF